LTRRQFSGNIENSDARLQTADTRRAAVSEEKTVEIHQTTKLKQDSTLSALVAQADATVKAAIDVAAAVGTWDVSADERGRRVLVLRVRDQFEGQCSATFAPDELRYERHLASRLHPLKGALVQVSQWQRLLQQLFDNIRQWCEALPGGANIEEEPIMMLEEQSGEYEVSRLVVVSNGQTMLVEPVALWNVGAEGRVDLKGTGGPLTLIYLQKEGEWYHLAQMPPITTSLLTQALFLELSEACLNG
jgi:hypothetical protein